MQAPTRRRLTMAIYYSFPAEEKRKCEVKLFASQEIYDDIEKTALSQLLTASQLSGVRSVAGMPDLHQGYGLPIGGVMACAPDGPISPGAVGFDINCGVRLIKTEMRADEIEGRKEEILQMLSRSVPAGLGEGSALKFSRGEFKEIINRGIPALVKLGLAPDGAGENCEDGGSFSPADPSAVSAQALKRGIGQLNSLGSGNHFLELQAVASAEEASDFTEGELLIMLHTGSRGFGHQICKDYSQQAKDRAHKLDLTFPRKNLAYFPGDSSEGQNYLKAMGCAANFAYSNRELLMRKLEETWKEYFPHSKLRLYYDHTHNIARRETHVIDGKEEEVLIHRKGTTHLPPEGKALIPGSMGTSSFVVRSMNSEYTRAALESVAHGAGRRMSRTQAKKTISLNRHRQSMGNIKSISSSGENILDESPLAYKDITAVISSLTSSRLAYPIAQLKPLVVLKG